MTNKQFKLFAFDDQKKQSDSDDDENYTIRYGIANWCVGTIQHQMVDVIYQMFLTVLSQKRAYYKFKL